MKSLSSVMSASRVDGSGWVERNVVVSAALERDFL